MKGRTDIEQIIDFLNVIRRNPGISMSRAAGYSGVHIGKLAHSIMPRVRMLVRVEQHSPTRLTINARGLAWMQKAEEVLHEIGGRKQKK